jgi:hypothetical protein
MRKSIFLCCVIACFAATVSAAEGPQDVVNFHLGFESFDFIENDDFVHRSGLKTIEDRGLKLTGGRFGSAVVMTKPTRITELDEMTGTDLDLVTAVVFNTRHRRNDWDVYNEPVMWARASSRRKAARWLSGSRATYARAASSPSRRLAWGRKEKFLLSVTADDDGSLGAYIVDSRYVRHEITSTVRATGSGWNHIVLNWNKAKGLELFLNGESVASSWGSDAWWMNPLPGLFHLPISAAAYDELYICSRPLSTEEIGALMRENTPPSGASGWSPGLASLNGSDFDRLGDAFGLSHALTLPLASPSDGSRAAVQGMTPYRMGVGHVPGRFCMDGRYELAWPHPIATFTIVPGDADFQAEKLDIETAPDDPYNFITIEGNFTGMPLALNNARKENNRYTGYPFFSIHQDDRFFLCRIGRAQAARTIHAAVSQGLRRTRRIRRRCVPPAHRRNAGS